ncbi:hypothetical protein [Mesoplasma florum]|uniref:hypothetical protein n=1 Tax=Mesoplasma florum TaxID=2151 RepID=UPI000BE38B3D|nr:hypothetical protein [Mesoplasma florum]ATI73961.1 hypothetical protein CQZ70_01695 [Mesoplasma florum]
MKIEINNLWYLVIILIIILFFIFIPLIIKSIKLKLKNNKNLKQTKESFKNLLDNKDLSLNNKIFFKREDKKLNLHLKELIGSSSLSSSVKTNLDFKIVTFEIQSNLPEKINNRQISWKAFTAIITSVITNDSRGDTAEAVNSIYQLFKFLKKLVIESENSPIIPSMLLKIINTDLRPILTFTRSFMFSDAEGKNKVKKDFENQEEQFWNKINDLKITLLERNDLKILCLFSQNYITTDEIYNLLNISDELKKQLMSKNKESKKIIDEVEKEIKNSKI